LSNASAGNENATAEAQSQNLLFECIHVSNPLTEFVQQKLMGERRNVILTAMPVMARPPLLRRFIVH